MAVFRYGAGVLQWKATELKYVNRTSRKTITMHEVLHLKSDVDRLYIKKKEEGRGLMNVERCVRKEDNSLGFYVANSEEKFIKGDAAAEKINTEDNVATREFKKQELKQNWLETKMHGHLIREIPGKGDKNRTW